MIDSDGKPEPPEGCSPEFRDGWTEGMAGLSPDPARCAGGANRMNDYERGYVASGEAARAAGLET